MREDDQFTGPGRAVERERFALAKTMAEWMSREMVGLNGTVRTGTVSMRLPAATTDSGATTITSALAS